jgi:hypothetical protein
MRYWRLFQESWQILWQRKVLWAFGLLAALGGGGFNFNWRIGDLQPVIDLPLGARALLLDFFRQSDPATVVFAGLVLGGVMFLLLTFAEGGLISLVNTIRNREPISLRAGLAAANQNFLPLLGVRGMLALPLLIVSGLIARSILPAFFALFTEPTGERLFNLGTIANLAGTGGVLLLLGLLITAIDVGAERAVVIEHKPLGAALGRGLQLFIRNFVAYVGIGVLFVITGLIVGAAFAFIMAPFMFVFILPTVRQPDLAYVTFTTNLAGPIAAIAVFIGLLLGILVAVFTSTMWTLSFREWQEDEQPLQDHVSA